MPYQKSDGRSGLWGASETPRDRVGAGRGRRWKLRVTLCLAVTACTRDPGGSQPSQSQLPPDYRYRDYAAQSTQPTERPSAPQADLARPVTRRNDGNVRRESRTEAGPNRAPAPEPAPAPLPAPVPVLTAGSTLFAQLGADVCTATSAIGETVRATISSSVPERGSTTGRLDGVAELRIDQLARARNASDHPTITLRLTSLDIGGSRVTADGEVSGATVERIRASSRTRDVGTVLGGAALGAIAGRLLGGTKGTGTGAVLGAAAGVGGAIGLAEADGCIRAGSQVRIATTDDLRLPATSPR